jgi:hypothetical protein
MQDFEFKAAADRCRALGDLFDKMAETDNPADLLFLMDSAADVVRELDELIPDPMRWTRTSAPPRPG